MSKSSNIIEFYMYANTLKHKIRTGWMEIGIEKERLESVAEHIFGCLILAIGINSEYDVDLDMYKVLRMLTLHETEEILMKDFSIRSNATKEQRLEWGRKCVEKVTQSLIKKDEIINLLEEFKERKTKEAKFCYLIDKIECDFQAKMYDLDGVMNYEKTKEHVNSSSKFENASDFWINYDKPKYQDDEIFKELIEEMQKRK